MTDHTSTETPTVSGSTVRPARPVPGAHAVAVMFSHWGHQDSKVDCHSGGGRNDQPYIAVTVGECLTYVYDRGALLSYLRTWERAAEHNTVTRLPVTAATASAHQPGQDFAIACNVVGWQRTTVIQETTPPGVRRLTVTVGAVCVRIYASEALRSHLAAWTRAANLAVIFDDYLDPTHRVRW
jgi:hypothetical protein